jgi:RNA polymerase sigma-70 factor (ECF subfamily)
VSPHDRTTPDDELAKRIRQHDRVAFELLFRRYAQPLCGFAYRYIRSMDIAEELVQDVFANIWERREEWAPQGSVKSYLFLSVRNRAFKVLKHEQVRHKYETAWAPEGVQDPMYIEATLDDIALRRIVDSAVNSLPERARLVFTLRREQELSYAEIATILGISIKTVENQMTRAIKLLQERLAPYRPK